MNTILEYIVSNYTWILCGIIIILLAIIGSYADKTNFGQGKQNKSSEEDENLPTDVKLNEFINIQTQKDDDKQEENNNTIADDSKTENFKDIKTDNSKIDNLGDVSFEVQDLKTKPQKSFEDQFEQFNEEFNETLPEKEVISEDLLDEIDSLSLDKTQKLNFDDIPDLDDVELPEIRNLKSNKDEDIWKF